MIRKYATVVPMTQEIMDDGVVTAWLVFRDWRLPSARQHAMAARKRMLELGWGEGRRGPVGRLP